MAPRIQLTKLVVLSWALGIPADGIVIAAALSTQVGNGFSYGSFAVLGRILFVFFMLCLFTFRAGKLAKK
jgi:hypothetical protein